MDAQFGERLLPQVVDQFAFHCPNRVFGCYPSGGNDASSVLYYREVTMGQLASAVDFLAWWITRRIKSTIDHETLSFMGIPDFRYPIFCLAAIKCGFKVLLPGTRSPVAQIKSLLRRTACTKIVYSLEIASTVEQLELQTSLEIPSLDVLLAANSPPFPYQKNFADVQHDPAFVIHSSGTTGEPKIITMTHGTLSVTDNDRFVPCPRGRKPQNGAQFNFEGGGGFYSCFPPYHLAGLQAYLILPIFSSSASIIIGPPQVPPSGQLMIDIIKANQGFVRACYVPPSMIDQWAQLPESMDQAKNLDFILYGGGPLPARVGNRICQFTEVCQMYGSAETGQIQLLVPQAGEWSYMEWNPADEVDMQPSAEGTYELVLHQNPKLLRHRSLAHNFPAVKEWRSGDLFLPHPTKPGLWRYDTRTDDLIVLANGHKINPVSFESHVQSHRLVSGAMVIGTNKLQPGLLLELVEDSVQERDQVMKELWPLVEQLNSTTPQYGQISRSKILLGSPERPFPRSPKGSLVRHATIALYSREIEELYSDSAIVDGPQVMDCTSEVSIISWVRESLELIVPNKIINDDFDFFIAGFDSLKVAEYTNILKSALRGQSFDVDAISNKTIYQNPTISRLARSIISLTTQSGASEVEANMEQLIDRYGQFSPPITSSRYVILTGAQGSLGSQVLQALHSDSNFEKVYCLVRRNTQELERNRALSALKKTEVIEIDLSSAQLGLDHTTYKRLTSRVDSIIHLAWAVDFNLSLQSFEDIHIRGLRSIINLSLDNPLKPQIVFSSSTAYATDWAISQGKENIPESLLPSLGSISSGYGRSKQVAECILARASRDCGIPVTVLRIGQISGSITGSSQITSAWSPKEWVPSLIATSKAMNLIPISNIPIDWIPVDIVAQTVINAITIPIKDPRKFQIHHLVNSKITPWMDFVHGLQEGMPAAKTVSLPEWLAALNSHDADDVSELLRLPALKLRDFFHGLVRADEFYRTKVLQFDVADWEALSGILDSEK